MKSDPDLLIYARFHHLCRELQKQNRFVGRAYGGQKTPVSETHTLIELQQGRLAPRHLAKVLGMAMTSLARTLDNLQEDGYIEFESSTGKGGKKRRGGYVVLSRAGREFLSGHHKRNEEQIRNLNSRLTSRELERLTEYFNELSHGLGESLSRISPEISPFRRAIIRLTRALGLMRKKVFPATDLNFLQWHILAELIHNRPGASAQDLCNSFGVPLNTMSAAVSTLVTRGLLSRKTDAEDGRKWSLDTTQKGRAEIAEVEQMDARRYREALKNLSNEQLRELDTLWSKLVGWSTQESDFVIQERITAKLLQCEAEIQSARRFLLAAYAEAPPSALSGQLLHASSDSYGLFSEERMVAVLELWQDPSGASTLGNLVASEQVQAQTLKEFILSAAGSRIRREPGSEILVDSAALVLCGRAGVPIRKEKDSFVLELGN